MLPRRRDRMRPFDSRHTLRLLLAGTVLVLGCSRAPSPRVHAAAPPQQNSSTPPPPQRPAAEDQAQPLVRDSDQPVAVDLDTFKRLFDARSVVIVDARPATEYSAGHVDGALNIPAEEAAASPAMLERLQSRDRPVVVYCSGPGCDLSKQLATLMLARGFRKVLLFEGGFPAWQAAGYPVESSASK